MKTLKRLFTSKSRTQETNSSSSESAKPTKTKSTSSEKRKGARSSRNTHNMPSTSIEIPRLPRARLQERRISSRSQDLRQRASTSYSTPESTIMSRERPDTRFHTKRMESPSIQTRQMAQERHSRVHSSSVAKIPSLSPQEILSAAWNPSLHKWDLKMIVYLSGPSKFAKVLEEACSNSVLLNKNVYTMHKDFYISTSNGYFIPNSRNNLTDLKNSILKALENPHSSTEESLRIPYRIANFVKSKARHRPQGASIYSLPIFFTPSR
ncbi:MAG: hypothetical protein ACRCV3_02080 [Desulfovibrionaceae bacterium]